MRILCIHGSAINSAILQANTTRLRSLLPPDYTFEWIDGNSHVLPQKALSDAYPGPYLSHLEDLTTSGVAAALSRIEAFIHSRGPFDGLMGVCEVCTCLTYTTYTTYTTCNAIASCSST
jgi:hypothetical protein